MTERVISNKLAAERVMAGRLTSDSFQNFAAKLGIGTDNLTSNSTYGFNPITRVRTLLEWMYRGSWLCGVGVDAIADDMTREWIEIHADIDPQQLESIYRVMRNMQIPQSFNAVAKWSRLYGGAVGIYMIEGQRLDTPLRLQTVMKGQFQGIIALDRWTLTPDLNNGVRVPGPDYGNPEWYTLDTQTPNMPLPRQRVHYTRLFRMEGVELPFWQKQSENMWGMSVMERLWDRLVAFDSTTQGAAQMVYRAYVRTYSIEGLRDIIAAGGKAYEAVVKNIEMVRRYQSIEGITVIDARDKMEAMQNTFAGVADVLGALGDQISGALETPLTRLFGQSPGGMGTTDENSMRMYEDQIKRKQERWFRRPLDIVIPLCAINAGVDIGDSWDMDFNSLRQMTESEKADVNTADVAAVVSAQGTGLLRPSTFLKELRNSGRKTGRWSNISDEEINDAEAAELVPSPSELGLGVPAAGETGEGNPDEVTKSAGAKEGQDPMADNAMTIVDVLGMQIFIETHMGSTRKGKGWSVVMPCDYGFIEGVGSAEGAFEQMDCYLGPDWKANQVWIIDQCHMDGTFDEHKCMIGFASKAMAVDCYNRAFNDGSGPQRMNAITQVSVRRFRTWLKKGDHKMPAQGQF